MQAPDRIYFTDNKPSLSNTSRLMDQLVESNPHMDLNRELAPDAIALIFCDACGNK